MDFLLYDICFLFNLKGMVANTETALPKAHAESFITKTGRW